MGVAGHAVVRPVRIFYEHEGLHVMVAKGVGYRAVDRDEWRGPIRTSFRAARADAAAHNQQHPTA